MITITGKATLTYDQPPRILEAASIVGQKEGDGPLSHLFDCIEPDPKFGKNTWEEAESELQLRTARKVLEKSGMTEEQIRYLFAGDLLAQGIATSYGIMELQIPLFGLYGACSTMAESLCLAGMFVDTKLASRCLAVTSSHFCSAERQFRFPLEYGGQRTPTAQWTVTGSGACIVAGKDRPPYLRAATVGTVEDLGITDINNMGAAMAPAAAKTLCQFFNDTGAKPEDFDLILTGDLGFVGSRLFERLMQAQGCPIAGRHNDCGLMIYDRLRQDVHAGGSGCGCAASVLCSFILPQIACQRLKNVLFMATGALMSPTSVQQGESIPGIAHVLHLSAFAGKEEEVR